MSMEEWLTSSLDSVHEVDILVTEKNEILKNWVEGKDILEVGCGTGNFVQYLVDKGYRVIATDILENLVEITKKKIGNKAEIMRDDIQNTKLKMQFDTIICSEVLEHIKKDKIAISNLVKLTKKGGCILITVPAHKWLFGCHDKNLGTFRRYTKNELIKKFTSNDVIVEKIRYWNLISLLPKFFYENYLKKQPEYKKTMDFLNKYPIMKFGLKILLRFDRTISRFFGITLMVKFRKI